MPVIRSSGKPKTKDVFGQLHKPPKRLRAGLYARVSTLNQQTHPMQMRAMRDYAANHGWTVAMQVKEVGSGAKDREQRQQLIDAARRREIDVVLVWRLAVRYSIWSPHCKNSRTSTSALFHSAKPSI
jgi:predicted site-specific integrase-resolvase